MKNKFNFIIVLLCLLISSVGTRAATANDSVDVSTYNEFVSALKANKRYIHLTADINMTNYESAVEKFTGEIDGLDYGEKLDTFIVHTIKNMYECLAVSMEGAHIHYLNFSTCEPKWHASSVNEGMGLICRNSTNCTFENLQLDGIKVSYNGFWQGLFLNPIRHYNGGIVVGKDHGSKFKNILIDNSYVFVTSTEGGGVVGDAYNSSFEDITLSMSSAVHVEGRDNLADGNAGGIAGRAENCTFTNCKNRSMVSAALDNVGGIAGKASKGCVFKNCQNYAFVGHKSISNSKYMQSAISSYSLYAIYSLGEGISAQTAALSQNQAALSAYIQGELDYVNKVDAWNLKYQNAINARTEWEAKWELYKSYANGEKVRDARVEVQNLEADQPVNTNSLKEVKVKTSVSSAIFTFAMIAVQIAQMVYEAQDEDDAGGIVGRMEGGGSILGCTNYGMIHSDDAFGGGIAGETSDDVIINYCHNAGIVQGYEQTGGIAGKMSGGAIANSLNTGIINTGNSSKSTFGVICGDKDRSTQLYHNCYVGETDGVENLVTRPISQHTFVSGKAARYLNIGVGQNVWRQTIGTDFYPTLDTLSNIVTDADIRNDIDTVFHVTNSMELLEACTNQYAKIVLDNDIEVASSLFSLSSKYMPFQGSLDGQGHKIVDIGYTVATVSEGPLNNDNHESRVAFFPYARNAVFKNLTLENIQVTIGGGEPDYVAMLVADSKNCTYSNVHITGTSKVDGWNGGSTDNVSGLVCLSEGDSFTDCSVGSSCYFKNLSGLAGTFYTRPVAGLVARSKGSTFTRCWNASTVFGDDTDYAGGIVAKDEGGSKLTACLNTGSVTAEEYVGGIIGEGKNTQVIDCVNSGTIKSTDTEHNAGGIIGEMSGSASLNTCLNFGNIIDSGSTNQGGALIGVRNEGTLTDCLYYCQAEETLQSNAQDIIDKVKSGEWVALHLNVNTNDTTTWYQAIDKNYSFPTHYPVPIPEAGAVYCDTLCDASNTISFSNRYHAVKDHTTNVSALGVCQECGYLAQAPEEGAVADISTTSDLIDFATLVTKNDGTYSALSARLMNDIDLDGCDFPTIGNSSLPYQGTFNGRGHRIKNMSISASPNSPCGFFQCLGDGAEIDSLIIDASCTVNGSYGGNAGIAASVTSTSGSTCNVTIRNCGNEAAITGNTDVAGILGGVYSNDNTVITIANCYNTGAINGSSESAAICGYARKNYTISNCYNTGSVTGCASGSKFYRNASGGTHTVANCYDVNGSQGTEVTSITTDQVTSGELCWKLNGSSNKTATKNGFYQNLDSVGSYPHLDVERNDIVETVNKNYCDQSTIAVYYNPYRSQTDYTKTFHNFDANGFCTSVDGETHYEEPDTIHSGSNIIYQLTNAGNLYWFAEQVNKGVSHPSCILMNDIVVNSGVNEAVAAGNTSSLRQWTPIGTESYQYISGTFNGNGHTISGLYCSNVDKNGVGLFGFAFNGATIKNVGVTDCYFNGKNGVGAIVGWGGESYADNTTWTAGNGPTLFQCFSTGKVEGKDYAGGLVGFINDGTLGETRFKISTCYSTAVVEGSGSNYGALFGYMGENITTDEPLNNCYWDETACTGESRKCYGTKMTSLGFSSGKVCELLNEKEEEDSIGWSQDLATQTIPAFGSDGVKLTRNIDQKWGTVLLPYTVYSDSTITYFEIDTIKTTAGSDIATLQLKQVDQVSANTPCFFYIASDTTQVVFRSNNRELTIPTTSTVEVTKTFTGVNGGITFAGTCTEQNTTTDQFVLTCDSVMWNTSQITASSVTMEPYHAYLSKVDGTDLSGLEKMKVIMKGADFDFNEDGKFDENDVSFVNSLVSYKTTSDYFFDANKDGNFTMSDVMTMVNRLLNPDTTVLTPPSSTGVINGK